MEVGRRCRQEWKDMGKVLVRIQFSLERKQQEFGQYKSENPDAT